MSSSTEIDIIFLLNRVLMIVQSFIASSYKIFVSQSRHEKLKVLTIEIVTVLTIPGQLSCVSHRLGLQFCCTLLVAPLHGTKLSRNTVNSRGKSLLLSFLLMRT